MTSTYPHPRSPARTALKCAARRGQPRPWSARNAAVTSLLIALICRSHVLLEGVPGTAKTLLVRRLRQGAADRDQAGAVHPGPDAGRHHRLADLRLPDRAVHLPRGPVFTNLLLADEINRTPPKTQAALLEAMEGRQVNVDGTPRPLPEPFIVAATQNPVEYEAPTRCPKPRWTGS